MEERKALKNNNFDGFSHCWTKKVHLFNDAVSAIFSLTVTSAVDWTEHHWEKNFILQFHS